MRVKARKVGNSIVVTIPKEVAAELAIDENTEMDVRAWDGALILEPSASRWDRLVLQVRHEAALRNLNEDDVADAVAKIRGRNAR
ncbi:MAG: AbrB/MazE/SpoVT family DNA-binding domain-containing protein [Thermoleophilia bacterium]